MRDILIVKETAELSVTGRQNIHAWLQEQSGMDVIILPKEIDYEWLLQDVKDVQKTIKQPEERPQERPEERMDNGFLYILNGSTKNYHIQNDKFRFIEMQLERVESLGDAKIILHNLLVALDKEDQKRQAT